jgi:primosomal protein N' (replication factor Y)
MTDSILIQVAVDTPVRGLFDYRLNFEQEERQTDAFIGYRVRVPFGHRELIGVIVRELDNDHEVVADKLRDVIELLDTRALLDPHCIQLLLWSASYYQYAVGAAVFTALPPALRKNKSAEISQSRVWLTQPEADTTTLNRAPKQRQVFDWLSQQPAGATDDELRQQFGPISACLKSLAQRALITGQLSDALPLQRPSTEKVSPQQEQAPKLTTEQNQAYQQIAATLDRFAVHLLEGVTGSGKTEVYFALIEQLLNNQKQSTEPENRPQILIIVPEIGLTPQLLRRLETRFPTAIATLHSNISEQQRQDTWLRIGLGQYQIILGTRLSVFTPIANLALIIIDEEHDHSLKQQEGFLYHARDVAIYRARMLQIPIVLGSATPSLESTLNAKQNRYNHILMLKRAQETPLPRMQLVDMRPLPAREILSPTLRLAMHRHLEAGNQVILFLNRRGFAPALICHECAWVAQCSRCDAKLTFHSHSAKLYCHHCDQRRSKPEQCPSCQSTNLLLVGFGTQRIEQLLEDEFKHYSTIRFDRDAIKRKGQLEKILEAIQEQRHSIIIGTQILSKGHDFPRVSLVGVLDIDYGIFSADYRALEHSAQLLTQVAGRSGRRKEQGEVVIQSHAPDHPLLQSLITKGYPDFAEQALALRQSCHLPPYSYQMLLRARATHSDHSQQFLQQAKQLAQKYLAPDLQIMGPLPATMEKRAGKFRAVILFSASNRRSLSLGTSDWLQQLHRLPEARRVQWNLDIDPLEGI